MQLLHFCQVERLLFTLFISARLHVYIIVNNFIFYIQKTAIKKKIYLSFIKDVKVCLASVCMCV